MNLGSRRRRWLCGYKHTRRIPGRTWHIHPLLPRRTISSHPCLPLYLYTCHRRSFVHRRGERKREIHASLNNPWPTLIRIFTRRNNIRPTVPADSPAIFYVRIIPTLRLPLSLRLADPYRFRSSFSLPPRLFHVCIPLVSRRISLFFLLSFFSLSLSLSRFPLLLICYCARDSPWRITRTREIMFYLCLTYDRSHLETRRSLDITSRS